MALACGKMRNHVWGYAREAASLREAPLPQTPSPEERLAFEVCLSSYLVPPEGGGGFLLGG